MTVPARLRTHPCRFCLCIALLLTVLGDSWCQSNVSINAFVPAEHEVIGEDQYVCFRVDLPTESLKIVGVDPLSKQDVVHHMLLFGTHIDILCSPNPNRACYEVVLCNCTSCKQCFHPLASVALCRRCSNMLDSLIQQNVCSQPPHLDVRTPPSQQHTCTILHIAAKSKKSALNPSLLPGYDCTQHDL